MMLKAISPKIYSQVEGILGCKWSLFVFQTLASGKKRPGEIRRSIPGISEKVLNERLQKLVRFEMACRKVFPEVPPRVEYTLTAKGKKFFKVIHAINQLSEDRS